MLVMCTSHEMLKFSRATPRSQTDGCGVFVSVANSIRRIDGVAEALKQSTERMYCWTNYTKPMKAHEEMP